MHFRGVNDLPAGILHLARYARDLHDGSSGIMLRRRVRDLGAHLATRVGPPRLLALLLGRPARSLLLHLGLLLMMGLFTGYHDFQIALQGVGYKTNHFLAIFSRGLRC